MLSDDESEPGNRTIMPSQVRVHVPFGVSAKSDGNQRATLNDLEELGDCDGDPQLMVSFFPSSVECAGRGRRCAGTCQCGHGAIFDRVDGADKESLPPERICPGVVLSYTGACATRGNGRGTRDGGGGGGGGGRS